MAKNGDSIIRRVYAMANTINRLKILSSFIQCDRKKYQRITFQLLETRGRKDNNKKISINLLTANKLSGRSIL